MPDWKPGDIMIGWIKKLFVQKPVVKKTDPLRRAAAIDTLARTLWGEARGQPVAGIEAVASVVLNRVKIAGDHNGRYWWGGDIDGVCRKPYQFSCWNRTDPNLPKLLAVTADNADFVLCLDIAARAVDGVLPDSVSGATHYHAKQVHPYWAIKQKPVGKIGDHVFYRLV